MTLLPQLRKYQQDIVSDVEVAYALGYRAPLVVLPTAGGKTTIFTKITSDEAKLGNRVWNVAHMKELLAQISKTLARFGVKHSRDTDARPQVLVASSQTLVRRLDRLESPTLIVIDECHHSISPTNRKILARFPDSLLLGVTATPCLLNGGGLGDIFDCMILGPTNSALTEDGFLSPVKYYAPPSKADVSKIPKRGGDYATKETEEVMDEPAITGDAISHYKAVCDGVPMIVACVSVDHAKHVAEQYLAAGYRAAHVDGKLSEEDRDDRIGGLGTGKYQVITFCELIGEGLDIPVVTALQILRPTASLRLHLQFIGRVLRALYGEGFDLETREGRIAAIAQGPKPTAYVLDHVGNTGSMVNGRWVTKHGFASTEHKWSLDPKRKMTGDKGPPTRTCENCYAVHLVRPACPYCGHEHPVKERTFTSMKVVDGTLVEVEQSKEEQRAEVKNARSIPELMAIAKSRKYKRPYYWALKTFQGRPIDTSLLK